MNEKHGRQSGTRSMVAVIRMGHEFGYAKLESSVAQALVLGQIKPPKWAKPRIFFAFGESCVDQ
jgi:hypothetical protein